MRAAVFGALVALASACSSGGGAVERRGDAPAVPVTVAEAVRRDAPVELREIGNVQAYATVSLKSQVEGQLARVLFAEGQEVKRDDLLFVVDTRPFEAALRQAEANVARDHAQAENARVELQRLGRLIKQGVVSRDEYDQARTRALSYDASVAADEAAVERARIELQYCYLRSPVDGRIGQILVHEGNVVKANETPLAVINQVRPVYVEFSVPQQELGEIRRRMAEGPLGVTAHVGDDGGSPVPGELTFVNNTVDAATGTVLLKALMPNADEALWPGQFVNVVVRLTVLPGAVVVPSAAIQTGQEGAYVFVVGADGTVESRPVALGHAVGQDVVVERGIVPGDRVVTEGQLRLGPGVRVEVKDTSE